MISLLEAALGFSEDTVYHFTTLKAADKILETGTFYPSYVHLRGDRGASSRYVSFTKNPNFEEGYPYNSRKRQLKPEKNQWGDDQYKKKDLIATVRFAIDVSVLESLVQQVTGASSVEAFEFPVDNLNRGLKPEDEERLWLKLREIQDFPKCITSICFYSIPSGSRKLNSIATRIFQAAQTRKIPCTYIRDGYKKEEPVTSTSVQYLYIDKFTNQPAGKEEEASDADYEKLAEAVAVCALDFRNDRHRLIDYIDKKFENLLSNSYEFRLMVERKIEDFTKDPSLMDRIRSNFRFISTKETKLPIDVQQSFFQMLDRTLTRTKTSSFVELINLRKQELQKIQESFNIRTYLKDNWLLQESKES